MSENPLTPFQEDIERVQLDGSARKRMRTHLTAFVENNPVHTRGRFMMASFSRVVLTSMALLVVITGGATVAAANALPGDTLYPVKVYVTEEIRRVAAVSSDASARYEIARVEQRLHEAEVLAELNMLDERTQETITHQLERNLGRAHDRIERIAERNPHVARGISSELDTTLRVHEAVLMSIFEGRDDHQGRGVLRILETVHDTTDRVPHASTQEVEQADEDEEADESTIEQTVSNRLTQITQSLSHFEERSFPGVQRWSFVQESMQQASDYVNEAEELVERELYHEALAVLDEAARLIRETQQFLHARDAIDTRVETRRPSRATNPENERSDRVPEHVPPLNEQDTEGASIVPPLDL